MTTNSDDGALSMGPISGFFLEISIIEQLARTQLERVLPDGMKEPHYGVLNHTLELVESGDFRKEITSAGLKQEMLGDSDVVFVLSAIFDRTRHKYGERGFRYVYIEAGHISQNIYLQAVSLGLGSVSVGAFLDDKVNQLIGVDGQKEAVIYLHAVGTL